MERDRIEAEARLERQDRSLFKSTPKRGPFHGESLKVIVKVRLFNAILSSILILSLQAANYILRPGEKYEGTWHIEGMVGFIASFSLICRLKYMFPAP